MNKPPYVANTGKYKSHYNKIESFIKKFHENPNNPEFTQYIKSDNVNPIKSINNLNAGTPN